MECGFKISGGGNAGEVVVEGEVVVWGGEMHMGGVFLTGM